MKKLATALALAAALTAVGGAPASAAPLADTDPAVAPAVQPVLGKSVDQVGTDAVICRFVPWCPRRS